MSGFPPDVRQTILDRCGGRCELCGHDLRTREGSVHHRRPRRMGGDRRPETSAASNGLAICGSGTTFCHGRIETTDRAWAQSHGIILSENQHPAEEPAKLTYGWVILTDDGRYLF